MRFVILIGIMIVAAIAGFFALRLAGGDQPAQTQAAAPQMVEILYAKDQIPLGTIITEDMVARKTIPQNLMVDGYVNSATNVNGMLARGDFQKDEPLSFLRMARPNDPNFLASTLTPGMRAVTLATDAVTGVAGFVFPGDRVDVLLTHNVIDTLAQSGGGTPKVSEALISNARVIAVDLRDPTPSEEKQNRATPRAPANITLEVTPEDAQKIRLAERNGNISLTLRSYKDAPEQQLAEPTVLPAVTSLAPLVEEQKKSAPVVVIRGTTVNATAANNANVPAAMLSMFSTPGQGIPMQGAAPMQPGVSNVPTPSPVAPEGAYGAGIQ